MRSPPRWTAAVVVGAALLDCAPAPRRTAEGTMRVGLYAAPLSLDPHLENEFLTSAVLANVFEGLTSLDGAMRVEPALAVSWDTPAPSTWRFRLRPGARFQDGRRVLARDVAWSLERARRHPRSGVSHYLADVVDLRVAAPDAVLIRTQASTSRLLNRLSFVAIVPEGSPAEIRSPIGTGPYRLSPEGFPEDLTLQRSDVYWGERPPVPVVRLLAVKDPVRARTMLLSGDLDVYLSPPPDEADRLRQAPCCRVVAQPAVVVEELLCRVDRPPFDDLRVRRALDLALDRPALVARTFKGWGEPASQLASPGTVGFAPTIRPPDRNVGEARRLLAEAGHPHGLSVTLDFREGRRADEIRRQLGEAGIEVTPRPGSWAEVLGRVRSGKADFYYGAFTADTGDAGDILDSAVHTPAPAAGLGADNHFGYSSPEVDRLLLAARTAPTLLDRRQALQRAMERVMADLPMVPLVVPDDLYVVQRDVRWTPRLDGRVLAADLAREPGGAALSPAVRSLRTRLAVALATIVAIMLLANAAWLVLSTRHRLRERLETSASLFASLATGPVCAAYDAYFDSGYFKFRQVVRDLLATAADVTRLEIVDVEGRVLFDSVRLDDSASGAVSGVSPGRLDPVRLEAARRLGPTTLRGRDAEGDTLEIVNPWVEDWGRHRLSVVYHVSYAKLNAEYRRYARTTLALTAVSIVLAALFGLALSRQLTRHLAGLTEGAREIAQGRFGGRLDVRTGDELQTVAEAFNEMAERLETTRAERERLIEELERRNAELERFTYTVSHDLRSPLVTVRGFVDLLEKDVAAAAPERVSADLARIRGATSTMEALLRELLELSRVGRVMNPAERVSLDELARQATALLHERLRAANVRVDVQPGLGFAHGDRTRLLEVFQNLIENAVKFRSGQGEPVVEVGRRPGPDGPVITVRDNGVGIDPRYHDRVFALFERLDPRVEGTGVGLALVKRIVEVHGGRVWVESEGAGQGSTFCFSLPTAP